MANSRDKFYFITLNLLKEKHKDLIKWIKLEADKNEQSFSSFCILILKKYMEEQSDSRKLDSD